MNPLMRLGYERFIVHEDLHALEPENLSGTLEDKLLKDWEKQKGIKEKCVFPNFHPLFSI